MTANIAVTGASGKLGFRVAQRLSEQGIDQLLVGRDPSRLPRLPGAVRRGPATYDDRAAMEAALVGADDLFLVSAHLSGRRLEEHSAVVEAAAAAGVRRVVYTSLLGASPTATYLNARDHADTEQFLHRCGLPVTILRCGFYASMLPGLANGEGVIRGPAGDGRVSVVSHDDIADVAVAVLTQRDCEHDGRTLEITGPESLDFEQIVERLSSVSKVRYQYQDQSVLDAYASRSKSRASQRQIEGWVTWYQAIKAGEVAQVTDTVPSLTGHRARPLEEALTPSLFQTAGSGPRRAARHKHLDSTSGT